MSPPSPHLYQIRRCHFRLEASAEPVAGLDLLHHAALVGSLCRGASQSQGLDPLISWPAPLLLLCLTAEEVIEANTSAH